MNTPGFWKQRSAINKALAPLSLVYAAIYLIKRALTVQAKLPVPVVCIGNVTAGGSGKTPVALAIGAMLSERGVKAFFVSRGYGGHARKPMLVNPEKHKSHEVGDEPLLLASVLPTVVGRNRAEAAQLAVSKGAKLLIFDDGFQNKSFYKDFSFLVIDGTVGYGNGMLIPAGPLRERPKLAMRRAHAIIMINHGPSAPLLPADRPVIHARTKVVGLAQKLEGQKVVAFCGIAYPEKFQLTLAQLGVRMVAFKSFADHAPLPDASVRPLAELAAKEQAYLVTTRKDFVRLPKPYQERIVVVDIELAFENTDLLNAQLDHIAGLA